MVNPTNTPNDMFDARRVRRLVELMKENDLSELDIQQGEARIQLKRNVPASVVPMGPMVPAVSPVPPQVAVPAAPIVSAPAAATPVEEKNIHIIKSPMVGTFFTASNPSSPPFVKVGDSVGPEKTVCLIEAMKVFNEIQAECSGKIVAVLVKNGESVEFGKPLFKVAINE